MRQGLTRFTVTSIAIACTITAAGCGGDETCDVVASSGCDDGQTCERVQGAEEPICAAPVVVTGRVFDLDTGTGIANARILGLDANNAAISFVGVSDAAGNYALAIPTLRTADGAPTPLPAITLRADAGGYVPFPSGIRPALPVDTSSPQLVGGRYVIASAVTDIGLLPLAAGPGLGAVRGKVAPNPTGAGVLVVAEVGGKGHAALADRDGAFAIFNVPAGAAEVAAYALGHNYERASVTVVEGGEAEVSLALSDAPAATVSGTVQIVNGQMGEATSVILVVESTFDAMLARGETPPGFRAPGPGEAPNITGAFSIAGIPAGRYVVLAGFENDFLVRDESTIGGTDIVHQAVEAGVDVTIAASFKVTGSVDIVGPGAAAPEMVTGAPMFRWIDDSSEDRYEVTVFDAYGNVTWRGGTPKNVAQLAYGGPALEAGMYYQFRVRSLKEPGGETIARSEDLLGVFYVP
jgi:hypothetical protein